MFRTLAMETAFLTAAAVAARMGTDRIAAHQIALQLWIFLALVLDCLAVAAQSLVGEFLGKGDVSGARATARRIARARHARRPRARRRCCWRAGTSCRALFTDDADVIEQAHVAWPWFAGMQPLAGLLFALDGILIGAGDVAFMRNDVDRGGPRRLRAGDAGGGGVRPRARRRLGRPDDVHRAAASGRPGPLHPAGAGRWPARPSEA